jgi:hypothetical protein
MWANPAQFGERAYNSERALTGLQTVSFLQPATEPEQTRLNPAQTRRA